MSMDNGRSLRFVDVLVIGAGPAGLAAAIAGLMARVSGTVMLPWNMPYGAFSLGLDPLSAFFLIPLFLLSGLAAVFALGYFRPWNGRNPGRFWLFPAMKRFKPFCICCLAEGGKA